MIKLSEAFDTIKFSLADLVHEALFSGGSIHDAHEPVHVATFVAVLSFTDCDGDITMVSSLYENQTDTISFETITHDLLSQSTVIPMCEWQSVLVMINPEQYPGQEMWVQREIESRKIVETMQPNEK